MTEPTDYTEKLARLDSNAPGWQYLRYDNGNPMFDPETGTMLDAYGNRSIFDDVDE